MDEKNLAPLGEKRDFGTTVEVVEGDDTQAAKDACVVSLAFLHRLKHS